MDTQDSTAELDTVTGGEGNDTIVASDLPQPGHIDGGGWVDRLVAESVELNERLRKLRDFIASGDPHDTLPWIEKDALDRQQQHMAAYAGVLDERLSRAPHDEPGDPENPEIDGPAAETLDGEAEA